MPCWMSVTGDETRWVSFADQKPSASGNTGGFRLPGMVTGTHPVSVANRLRTIQWTDQRDVNLRHAR